MKQTSFGLDLSTKKTREREFLDEMNRVVPWTELVALIEPQSPRAKTGRPPFPIETMLRIHFLQQWFGLSDPAMDAALRSSTLSARFRPLRALQIVTEDWYLGFQEVVWAGANVPARSWRCD